MTFYFGLNINRNMTDIENSAEALKNIDLDLRDLDRIRGVTDPGGVTRSDFKCLSGLNLDLEKSVGSLSAETSTYNILTSNFYDDKSLIDANLTVNGQFAATAIKYRYLENTTNAIKTADISTSRVSSWSSFSNAPGSPIFYGGQVDLEGNIELSDLTILGPAEAKRFESEIPTHRIEIDVNNEKIFLLAMKGIPLVFTGFFRDLSPFIRINQIGTIRPSWVIKNLNDSGEFTFQNVLTSTTSQISFRDTQAKPRNILFYYPVDNIAQINLPNANLTEMPEVVLTNLNFLNLDNNDFREMPVFSNFPSLATLSLQNVNLTRSQDPNLRTLNSNIVARFPQSLRNLTIGNCYSGASTADFSSFSLVSLSINAGSRLNRRLSGVSPSVNPNTIETYDIRFNLFTNIAANVKNATKLRNIYIDYNSFNNTDMFFNSQDVEIFSSMENNHNLVNLAGRTKLTTYLFTYAGIAGGNREVTDIFNGCTSLSTINLYASAVTGRIPPFQGCNSLSSLEMRFTRVTDAVPASGGNPPYVIGETTFDSCRNTISFIGIRSSFFNSLGEFHPSCFRLMPSLSYLEISSNKTGVRGNLPDFSTARNVQYILLYNNNLSGNIPNFSTNTRLFFINLANNLLEGSVPNVNQPNFQHLILTNNRLDTFFPLDSVQVVRIHLDWNNITRIPDLSNLINLQELLLNNQRLGSANTLRYTIGSFVGLRSLRNINLANNSMTQGAVDQIILDFSANYDNNPRRNVTVNLRGNSAPSTTEDVTSARDKLTSFGWRILTN